MQFLNKLAAYGQAMSRKQIAIVCGLVAAASIGGFVLADYLSAPVGDALSDQVGAIQADFKVTESGAATYNIKIYTPPGTAGVAPQVSLAYSSQGGNSVMGKGWAISGTSGISRCRASREAGDSIVGGVPVDGDFGPVNFTGSDRFCLDGQRLLEVSNATDACKVVAGATVMSLRTEIESFQRVCAYTFTPANGPRFFTVERKDGSTSWYGDRVSNSPGEIGPRADGFLESNRLLSDGTYAANTTVANWLQTRFQDSTGNYIDYLYLKNPTQSGTNVTGELLLSEVKYTGKLVLPGQAGVASDPYASVKFNYGLANQTIISYQSGARFTQSQRLNSVTVINDGEVVRHYPLTYIISSSGTQATLLSQIQECAEVSAQTCMQPTVFNWSVAASSFVTADYSTSENWNNSRYSLLDMKVNDVDGDGLGDIVAYVKENSGNQGRLISFKAVPSTGSAAPSTTSFSFSGYSAAIADSYVPFYYTQGAAQGEGWFLLDYNGDGFDDLALSTGISSGNWVIRPSSGPQNGSLGFNSTADLLAGLSTPIPSNKEAEYQPKLADLNGDGLMDIVYFKNDAIKARLMEKVNGSYGWFTERAVVAPDICSGITTCSYVFDGLFRKNGFQQINDFNGDARSDLLLYAKITAAKDAGIFDTQGDISIAPKAGISSSKITKRMSFSLTVDRITTTEISLKRYSWWDSAANSLGDRVSFADSNGDGLLDLILNKDGFISNQINTGAGFRPEVASGNKVYWYKKLQIVDINGDGRADIVYPDNVFPRFMVRYADINGIFGTEQVVPGGNAKTNCKIGSNTGSCLDSHIYQFGDFDGDASVDFLRMRVKSTSGLEGNDAQTYVSRAGAESRNTPHDVITEIKNGLAEKIVLGYLPLTNKDTYRRPGGASIGLNFGRGSPVQDFMAPMYVVTSVDQSAPTQANPNAMRSMYYRYAGAKLQAGGRGLLGFYEITSFDPNTPGYTIATTQKYHQGFPSVGVLAESSQRILPGNSYNPKACLVTNNAFCYAVMGDMFPALGGTLISKTTYFWEHYPNFNPGLQVPTQMRPYANESETYDANNGERISRVSTVINYDAWGNTLQTAVDTYTGTANSNPVTVTTNNTYVNDTLNWRLSRMTQSAVTHSRNGQAIVRNTSFDYDMAGPVTGFLKSERISPNGAANQDMRKEYNFDAYGNRIASFSCSQGIVNCKSTALQYSPWDVTQVHRYSRVEYDSRGRYITGTFEPFNTPGQLWDSTVLTEYKTQNVLARDKYGEITHAKDVNGVSVVSQRSAMGRDYWTWVQTVPGATPGDPAQGIDSYKTYRYCGAGTNQVLCPTAAKFREQILTDAAPKHWTYFDSLKRPVMEITETFNDGVSGKDFSAVCKSYDINGRTSFVSDPFFLSAAQINGEPSFGGIDPCVSRVGSATTYDVLGRPIKVLMSDSSQSTVQYDRLKTTSTNNLGQNKIEEKDASGELVQVTDNLGFQTQYSYDAAGNLSTVKRNAGRGEIVTTMLYDSLGRKIYMKDPDAGEWGYLYYPSGEVENQYNVAEGIYRVSRYDYRGRLVWSGTKNRNDVWESVNVSSFDTAANGIGQVNCTWEDGFQYRVWQGDSSKSNNFTKCQQYDNMGRVTTTTTKIDDSLYYQVARYDALSRAYKSMDASGKWTKTEFSPRGMGVRTCESTDADTDPTCASNVATTYLETLETDARGHVVKEQRGGTTALQLTRTYDPLTGALLRTCAGNNCQIVDENLQWDSIGNLQSRDIAQKYREEYSYDGLNRLTEGRFARLESTSYATGSQPISAKQTYDALGNLCS
ncbi:MAG: FG-GAP-like repeat-containing protein, partial [Arenimonas sp.]